MLGRTTDFFGVGGQLSLTPRFSEVGTSKYGTMLGSLSLTNDATDPPAYPMFTALAPQNINITNLLGVITITATCPTSSGENTVISACAPQHSGVRRPPQLKLLGTCPRGRPRLGQPHESLPGLVHPAH